MLKTSSSPTSQDVARLAGVSRSIVSGVLNGTMSTMRVSEETRERILKAAQELGYTPNPVARALRRQRSNVLGFVPRVHRYSPYDQPVPFLISSHLAKAALRHGYHVVEASSESPTRRESDELVRFLIDRHVDGIVLDSPDTAGEVARIIDRHLPVVQMIRPQVSVLTPSVMVDAVPGITEAIKHFVEMGHRDIAFIGTRGQHPVDRGRLEIFRDGLASRGLELRPQWTVLANSYDIVQGHAAAERLLKVDPYPSAIFITGDNLAVGVLQLLYERGIRVPDDLSIISYDDIFAGHLAPPLTSVSQPLEDVADQAVALLAQAIDAVRRDEEEPKRVVLPTRLVTRGSVRRLTG
jgi:DNA-binding LacI/PurR family transcriptional regulator